MLVQVCQASTIIWCGVAVIDGNTSFTPPLVFSTLLVVAYHISIGNGGVISSFIGWVIAFLLYFIVIWNGVDDVYYVGLFISICINCFTTLFAGGDSVFAQLFYNRLNHQIALAKNGEFDQTHIQPNDQSADEVRDGILHYWGRELERGKPSLTRALANYSKSIFLSAMGIKVVHDVSMLLPTYILQRMVRYLTNCRYLLRVKKTTCDQERNEQRNYHLIQYL